MLRRFFLFSFFIIDIDTLASDVPDLSRDRLLQKQGAWRFSIESVEGTYEEDQRGLGLVEIEAEGGIYRYDNYEAFRWGFWGLGAEREVLNVDSTVTSFFGENQVKSETKAKRELDSLFAYLAFKLGDNILYGVNFQNFWGKRKVLFGLGIDAKSETRYQELDHELFLKTGPLVWEFSINRGTRIREAHLSLLRHGYQKVALNYNGGTYRASSFFRKILASRFDNGSKDGVEYGASFETLSLPWNYGAFIEQRNKHFRSDDEVYLDNIERLRWGAFIGIHETEKGRVSIGVGQAIHSFDGEEFSISYRPNYLKLVFTHSS